MSGRAAGPMRGLPERLPEGETVLWQGAPRWQTLALRAFHVRGLSIYFAILLVWFLATRLSAGFGVVGAVRASAWIVPLSLAAIGLVALFSWLTARSTVYTITNRRVALHFGIALPMTINIPFRFIHSVDLRVNPDDSGDLVLTLTAGQRLAYLVLWPHVRPWHLARSKPMLRGLPDVAPAAQALSRALAAGAPGQPAQAMPGRLTAPAQDSGKLAAAAA